MKQRALAIAIRRTIWAELALSSAIAVPAFAQSQPATPAVAASGTATAAAPAAASGTAATSTGTSNTKNVKQLQTFQVTGSLIRQADKVGFQQVQVVTQQDIQNSGAQSVADYMRSISANSADSWGEATSDSFAAGGSGIALRGLSEKYTLMLVDGQRGAPFAFAVNGSDQFFDLNTLPLDVIDRIEVAKTGAVSQYGSAAIAGVVNIITKHDLQGLELDGSYGGATQGGSGTTKFSQSLPTKIGTFKFTADWAYVWHFYMNNIGGVTSVDGAGNDLTHSRSAVRSRAGRATRTCRGLITNGLPICRGNTQLHTPTRWVWTTLPRRTASST